MNKSEDGSEPGQGTSVGYEITDGHCVSPPGNPTKGKDLEEDELDDCWKGITWQRIAQDRQTWKLHAKAFAQPRDTMAAQ